MSEQAGASGNAANNNNTTVESNTDRAQSGSGNNNNANGRGNGGTNNNNGSRRNDGGRNRNIFSANERSWCGDKPEIGAVLGLRVEHLDHKHSYRSFLEKMTEYVLRELNNPNDVLELLTEEKDPRPSLKANIPVKLEDDDKDNEVLVAIQQHTHNQLFTC